MNLSLRSQPAMAFAVGVFLSLNAALPADPPKKSLPLPGEVFELSGRTAFLLPATGDPKAASRPWVWYAPTLPNLPGREEKWMFERFLAAGIAVAGIDAGESYGSPVGNKVFDTLHAEMVRRGYSAKPVLLGRSRGGLMALSWATANPDKVRAFAGIYPVCDLASYPGVAKAAGAFGLKADELKSRLTEFNPADRLDGLARAKVPLFAVHGDVDKVVPLEANSGRVKERYAKLGGPMTLIVPKGQGHNMWSGFFQCEELVAFVLAQAGRRPEGVPDGTADEAAVRKAVTFYASFDEAVKGDFGGELDVGTRRPHPTEKGRFVFQKGFDAGVLKVSNGKGVAGGAFEATGVLPKNGWLYFPVKGNLAYKKGGWSGSASVWCNTDPNRLITAKFCDPLQITQKGYDNGALWFDFNDKTPRDLRFGAFTARTDGRKAVPESDPKAPLVWSKGVNWKAGEWHHVVLTFQNLDTGKPDAVTTLYLDGKRIGEVKDQAIAMGWEVEQANVYLSLGYVGLLDEFALFNRALTADEVTLLQKKPDLLTPLKKR